MKVLKKEMVVKRKQYDHTLSERRILESIAHPFIVSLRYAFQSELKLYMVFGTFVRAVEEWAALSKRRHNTRAGRVWCAYVAAVVVGGWVGGWVGGREEG